MISVIIPLYNKETQIGRTLKSVLSQSYQDFEVVIVNDGSTDSSVDIVHKIDDPRIRVINQKNAGVAVARNNGIAMARGEFIALLDGDDLWKETYLETQFRLAQEYPECDVFVTNYEAHNEFGKVKKTILRKLRLKKDCGILTNYFEIAANSNPPICSISIMVRKGVFESVGGFPVGIKSGEDLLTWARLACKYKIAYSHEPLAVFNEAGYDVREKPKRLPAEDDVVGQELVKLYKEYNPPHIKDYIALWHKMRSSIYMRLRMRRKSIKEACIGLRYNPCNLKLYVFILLNCLPSKFQPF